MVLGTGCNLIKTPQTDDELAEEINKIIDGVDLNAGSDYKGTLKVYYQTTASEVKIMDSFLNAFQEAYPNIEIKRQPTVSSNYQTLLPSQHSTAYQTKNYSAMPDIIWTTNEILAGWVEKDVLMPLDFFDQRDENFSAEDTFVDTMLQDSMLGEHAYMYPRDYDQFVMYYNRKLLNLAGISEDRIPSDRALSHDELDQLMRDIRTAFREMTGTNPENNRAYNQVRALDAIWAWGSLCWPTLKSFGGSVVDADGTVNFDNAANIEATTYLRELIKDELTFGVGTAMHTQFKNQLTVLCVETRAVLTDLIDRSNSDLLGIKPEDLGVAPMPNIGKEENYAIGAGCSGYGMYRYAENPTEAWLFLKFMASEAGQNAFSETGNGVPSNKNLLMKSDAVWRNLTGSEFSALTNFNHEAFVYRWDTAGCTLQDFKLNISALTARQSVAKTMSDVVEECLGYKDTEYEVKIKDAFAKGQSQINRLIQTASK